jgi:hypothetical protein
MAICFLIKLQLMQRSQLPHTCFSGMLLVIIPSDHLHMTTGCKHLTA